jgi:hypothetical protein
MDKKEQALSLMTDVVEGPACSYWAEVKDAKRNADFYVTEFKIRDAESDEDIKKEWVTITADKILEAVKKLINDDEDYKICRSIIAQFVGREWDFDQEGADVIIQIAVFNKIIFG